MTTTPNGFDTWQRGLTLVVADALGLSEPQVSWFGQPRQHVAGPRAQLEPIGILHRGTDEKRYLEDSTEEVLGARALVIQVRIWNAEQALEASPRALVERLRTRLRLSSMQRRLRALDLSLEVVSQPVHSPTVYDARRLDESLVDLTLGYTWVEREESAAGFIETVLVSSRVFRDVNGTALPDGVQFTNDRIGA